MDHVRSWKPLLRTRNKNMKKEVGVRLLRREPATVPSLVSDPIDLQIIY